VEIWSDVVCPWCYIGKRRFESALLRFEHAEQVEVRWRSFELDPRAPQRRPGDAAGNLAAKYGMSLDQARARLRRLDELAAAEGLQYNLAETKGGNTFAAHRLIHLGTEHGVGDQVKEGLLRAYFVDLKPVSDPDVLSEVGEQAGLDRSEVVELLAGDRFGGAVRADEAEATALGATGVPFFVIDRAFAVAGAQDAEVFVLALRQAWTKVHPPAVVGSAPVEGPDCAGGACST
jgi:predicted DsbA family dithiol-disulfide isomerase